MKSEQTLDDDAERLFRATANSFITWHLAAYDLIGGANLCFRRHLRSTRSLFQPPDVLYCADGSPRVFKMLYAMALEDLLKALWLAQGNRAATEKVLKNEFKTHDLRDWWTKTSMRPLDEDESVVLDFLMSYAEIGRSLSARARRRGTAASSWTRRRRRSSDCSTQSTGESDNFSLFGRVAWVHRDSRASGCVER